MGIFFSFTIKLLTIFLGSGFVSLLAYYVAREIIEVPKLILEHEKYTKSLREISISSRKRINNNSASYEIVTKENNVLKILSSNQGMKLIY